MNRRTLLVSALTMAAAMNASCAEKTVMMDIVVFNYWPRPVNDVFINKHFAGLAEASGPGDDVGGGGMVAGVPVTPGKQVVKWMLDGPRNAPRLGETVTASFDLPTIPMGHSTLVINIYPDGTVFLETGKYISQPRLQK